MRSGTIPESLWNGENRPVSSFRIMSYINNPRGKNEDVILYIVKDVDKLVGYRTVLPDDFLVNGNKIHFGWQSGFWVHPDYRKRGIGVNIQKKVLEYWQGVIGIDYTLINKMVMLKSEAFSSLPDMHGIRIFFRSPFKYLVDQKKISNKFIKASSVFGDIIIDSFLAIKKKLNMINYVSEKWKTVELNNIDEEAAKFIDEYDFYSTLNRRSKEFKWILEYPWIANNEKAKSESFKYHFSVYSENYKIACIKIYYKSELRSILIIGIRDSILKLHYIFNLEQNKDVIGKIIMNFIRKNEIKLLISYDKEWKDILLKYSSFRLFYKETIRYYMASKKLIDLIGLNNLVLKDGDGDAIFV